ncbi:hypothetical protein PH349_03410 [Methanobrevibacter smithii]|jgi:hypothetical protein|uniref:hypothetical protein n=1 Tax=Methanobrevibacter smithii TaxID=2173 RepID=UPI002431D2BE|nr:hypothetical protein [Methanobrevibacter smithii]HJI98387.1 hypothetical protein [Methanobrevibacter smithii]
MLPLMLLFVDQYIIMDDWNDDAYGVIYDEHDRERTTSPNNSANNNCCGVPFIFAIIGLILVMLM